MAKQRIQVQDLSAPPGLRPVASPTDAYYRPNLSAPKARTVYDFGPLSDTLRKLFSENMTAEGEKQISEGEQFFALNPAIARQVNEDAKGADNAADAQKRLQDAFGKLVREGKLHEAGSPLFQRGFAVASARAVVSEYRNRLMDRVAETTRLVNPEDGLPTTAGNPDAIIGDEWQKLADNPALQNFYGRQVAADLKQRVDEEFKAQSSAGRADAIADQHKTYLASQVAERFDQLRNKDNIEPADLQQITDFVTQNVYATNVKEPRKVVWQGLKLHLTNVANTYGPQEALRMADLAAELNVGGLALGKDAEVGAALADKKASLLRQVDEADNRERATREDRLRDAKRAGALFYLDPLLNAFKNGDNIMAVRDALDEELKTQNQFGEFLPEVRDDLFAKADALSGAVRSDSETLNNLRRLISQGKFEEATTLYEAGVNARRIVGPNILEFEDILRSSQSVTAKMENNASYNASVGRIKSIGGLDGYAPDVQAAHEQFRQGLLDSYTEQRVNLVLATQGDPQQDLKLSEFDRAQVKEIQQKVFEREAGIRSAKQSFHTALTQRLLRHTDGTDIIEAAFARGDITTQEYAQAQEANLKATDRSAWFGSLDVREALANIDAEIEKSADLPDEDSKRALRGIMYRRFEDVWNSLLDERLPSTEPRSVSSLVRTVSREAEDEALAQLGAGSRKVVERKVVAGESAVKAGEEQSRIAINREAARQWEENVDPNRSAFTADNPLLAGKLKPEVPQNVRDSIAALIRDPVGEQGAIGRFFTPEARLGVRLTTNTFVPLTPREKAEDSVAKASMDILSRTDLDEKVKRDAVLSMREFVGITPDELLKGELTIQRTPLVQQKSEELIRTLETQIASAEKRGETDSMRVRQWKGEIQFTKNAIQTPHTLPLGDAQLNPYTTPIWRSPGELQLFVRTRPDDFKTILRRLGVPEDETSVQDFVYRQINAIKRVR